MRKEEWKMRYGKSVAVISLTLLCAVVLQACAGRVPLKTQGAMAGEVQGTYDLILFGANHGNDIATIAILDKAGDGVRVEPHAPPYVYRVKSGLSAQEALHDADEFIRWHHAFRSPQLSRIIDASGTVIGYEMRPLYRPLEFGVTDVLDISYTAERGKVVAWIRLIPSVEAQLFDNDRNERQRN